ncbi:MAG: L,D-transpeptidase family protein [Hydrogenophilales bacterium]|nr:L,D-transpeptidase family protein [Hydrogenophilales bacterium]
MLPKTLSLIRCTALAGLALLAGCQSLGRPAATPPPVALPALPAPVAMYEFTLNPMDDVVGTVQVIKARDQDTLSDIARRFNVGYEEIVAANPGVDPWLPGAGTEVVIPTEFVLPDAKRQGIVINLAAMRLFYFPQTKAGEPQRVITHPIGIGRVGWRTPEGSTKVVSKTAAPAWTPTPAIRKEHAADGDPLPKVVPPGPDNPMGTHVLRLGWPEYAIHGTDKPPSIGLRGTHGCLRLYPEDIVGLYDAVPVGTPVTVVNQPVLVGWRGDTLVMQTYPVLEDDKRSPRQRPDTLIDRVRKSMQGGQGAHAKVVVNEALAAEITHHPRAVAVPISTANLTLQQYLAAALRVENKLPLNSTWDGDTGRQVTAAHAMKGTEAP